MATVVLDAGHGGSDPGAVNGTRTEKSDTLRLTLAIGEILQNCGVNIIFTRTTDVFIPLGERSRISNNANANLFVSLHRNASDNPAAHGFEVHVYTNPSQTAINLANNILSRINPSWIQSNRGMHKSNFSVLRQTNAPAVLVETNFITNAADNQLFDLNLNNFAQAIANGVLATLGINCGQQPPVTSPPTPPTGVNDKIASIQQTLNTKYNVGLLVDGLWGKASKLGLTKALQIELNNMFNVGLDADGLFGSRTLAAIPKLRKTSRGNLVYILQVALFARGYNIALDGIFGPGTENAVKSFQSENNLTADGIAGPRTFAALFN
jgi:N-acetylmuramoyl-L-alanine amidase